MATVSEQVRSADDAICQNISSLTDQRELLSRNVLSHLRNLVEGVAVWLHHDSPDVEFTYPAVPPAIAYAKANAKFRFLGQFHKQIQKSVSHYSLAGDASERLMLKYYEYLHRIRRLLRDHCQVSVLSNLEDFPVDLDPSLREYHEKIANTINAAPRPTRENSVRDRYYIHRTRPFFVDEQIYYEVTFYRAINKVSKFDRIIAFTNIEITDKYAANLILQGSSIEVLGQAMPITIIKKWEVSIRPCEINNFARLLGIEVDVQTSSSEYRFLMHGLTVGSGSLLDLIDMPDERYTAVREAAMARHAAKPKVFPVLDEARRIVRSAAPGKNILRYLMLRMNNQIIKAQHYPEGCARLSGMKLKYGCIPFDTMPFCTSLPGHNPRYWDLVESLDVAGRKHELLARRVKNNVERRAILYTPEGELREFENLCDLVGEFNNNVYYKHTGRKLVFDKGHLFIREYEDAAVNIVEILQRFSDSGIAGYRQAVERWIDEANRAIDDPLKQDALKLLFTQSRVALIYGAAGTGKSTMVDHIANYFNDKRKLFLAHTNPAVDNLKRRVSAQNATFRTISSQVYKNSSDVEYDLLVIDECSTVSNASLIEVLKKVSFRLLVLVGDVYQIESIQFGNWFRLISAFIPNTAVFELTTPFRTNDLYLLEFWEKVRNLEDDISEVVARNGYSSVLDESLFEAKGQDEIILCLNYDGLYGINNINRFLQSSNSGNSVTWRESMYKVGDPVLFYETDRFHPVIYNNLKGWIVAIEYVPGKIQFDVDLDRPLTEFDVSDELEWMGGSVVRFSVFDNASSDEDDDSLNTTVPFQVAYAVSIHKAQGLEYDSVKVVITDANEDDITHSIFYTAVTRARKRLRIFWTPETQERVLKRFNRRSGSKDSALLANRRGLRRVS